MFFKLSNMLRLQSLRTPKFNFATAAYPLLFKNFPNKCDTTSSFLIKQLEEKEIDEAASCIAEAFTNREMIVTNFHIQYQTLYEGVKKDLQKALESNLCLVCRDRKTNKLAGVSYYEDLKEAINPKIWQENMTKDENWDKLQEFYKYMFQIMSPYADPKERNDVLLFKKLAVTKEFTQLGVAQNLMFAARYIHPRTTKAKRRLMIASNERTYNFCKKHGWELIKSIDVSEYNLMPNNKGSFTSNGFVHLMKYEPKEGKSLIQEIKSFFD